MRIVVTGGGSGGHIFPIFSLLPQLLKNGEVFYVGEKGGKEEEFSKKYEVPFFGISETKLQRGKIAENLSIPKKLFESVKEALVILKKLDADVLFSKGGYVALPVVLAAKKLNIPIVIHESDINFGLSNRISLFFAEKALTSFKIKSGEKFVVTSAPIRDEILLAKKEDLFFDKKPVLLILGGSLGASELNEYVKNNKERLQKDFNVVLISGENKGVAKKESGYIETPFQENIGKYLASSDVCISRGGAGTLFELAIKRVPSVIVPLNNSASRGEQKKNAEYFANRGIFLLHDEKNDLLEEAKKVFLEKEKYIKAMENSDIADGKDKIVEEILSAARGKNKN